ncbi:hypothetical protein SETIT_7G149500v2 [Setaria italica]|uniref:Uncharacterized protein n=2 Tax=Setaria TaxID=4554 RepID=A0A368RVQ8_SETIT|nr:hypothetical protein SETIT_7G149500v2 [Setaria italica]TKW05175.1 hypothetical protein SEVIR_7G157600v2 [Setaria viridis]
MKAIPFRVDMVHRRPFTNTRVASGHMQSVHASIPIYNAQAPPLHPRFACHRSLPSRWPRGASYCTARLGSSAWHKKGTPPVPESAPTGVREGGEVAAAVEGEEDLTEHPPHDLAALEEEVHGELAPRQ